MANPLLPVAIVGALLLWLSRRGSAPQLAPFSAGDTELALDAICSAGGAVPSNANGLASFVLTDAYPGVTWPPRLGSDPSQTAIWRDAVAWASDLIARANGIDVCEYIRNGGESAELGTFVPTPPPVPLPQATFVPTTEPPTQAGIVPGLGLPAVSSYPTPGQRYQIKYGDTLLKVAGQAYQVPGGPARLQLARKVNDNQPYPGVRYSYPGTPEYQQSVGNLASAFPNGVISFGVPFQIIYIPPA